MLDQLIINNQEPIVSKLRWPNAGTALNKRRAHSASDGLELRLSVRFPDLSEWTSVPPRSKGNFVHTILHQIDASPRVRL